MITSGSNTRLDVYESCPQQAYRKYVLRIPEPDRGPPPPQLKEWPNDRGSRIHDLGEEFVKGNIDTLPRELINFSAEFHQARELYARDLVETENMWCFDKNWNEVPETSKKTTFRIKIDLTVALTPNYHLVTDYKTGKRWGNEIKHGSQKTTYAIGLFKRKPEVQKVTTELWYLDLPDEDIHAEVLTRSQGIALLRGLNARLQRMLDAKVFPTRPSNYTCKWCPYNPKNGAEGDAVCRDAVNNQPRKSRN